MVQMQSTMDFWRKDSAESTYVLASYDSMSEHTRGVEDALEGRATRLHLADDPAYRARVGDIAADRLHVSMLRKPSPMGLAAALYAAAPRRQHEVLHAAANQYACSEQPEPA
eukprot:scaffold14011_cov122-Isochrysis_galbana.AAC.6